MHPDDFQTDVSARAAAKRLGSAVGHFAAIERAEFRMRCLELAQKCWNDLAVTHQKLSLYDLADRFLRYVTEADAPKPDVQAFDVEGPGDNASHALNGPAGSAVPVTPEKPDPVFTGVHQPDGSTKIFKDGEPYTPPAVGSFDTT